MKSQPGRGDGWWRSGGEQEGGVQQSRACRGVPPMGAPLGLLQPQPQHEPSRLCRVPPRHRASRPPRCHPTCPQCSKPRKVPLCPQSHPGNAGVTSLPWDIPGSAGGFPAPTGAEQEGAASPEGRILQQLTAQPAPKLLPYFLFKAGFLFKAAAPGVL